MRSPIEPEEKRGKLVTTMVGEIMAKSWIISHISRSMIPICLMERSLDIMETQREGQNLQRGRVATCAVGRMVVYGDLY